MVLIFESAPPARGQRGTQYMKTWRRNAVALFSALAALATCGLARAQDIPIIEVALVAGAPIQFHPLPAPSPPLGVRRVVQDRLGFLWLSAADGMRRYDGYGFVKVPEGHSADSIGLLIGQSLMTDRAGQLWIGADDSLNRYDPATGSFKQYQSPDLACGTVAVAHDIVEDQDGVIWLATDDGLTALDPATSKTTCHRPRYTPSVGETRVIATIPIDDGTLWVTSSEGLYTLDRRSGKVTAHNKLVSGSGQKFVSTGFPSRPFQDSRGALWIGLSSGGDLASVDTASGAVTVYAFRNGGLTPNASSGVVSIQEDNDGALWLGTNKLGLVKLTPDRKQALWYQSDPDDPDGLRGDLIVGLFKDRDGSFWSTTRAGAVYRFESERTGFRSYRHQPANPHSLGKGAVTAVYTEDVDTLWIGTDRALNRVDRTTDQVTQIDQPVFARGVSGITKDSAGHLWVGTHGNGLVRFDPRSGEYTLYTHDASDPRSLNHNRVSAVRVDRSGSLWIATDFGLSRWEPATQDFSTFRPQAKGLVQYRSIAEDANGALWLATQSKGVQRFDPGTGEFKLFDAELRDAFPRGHNRVNSAHVDRAGTVWAATFRGLGRLDPRDGTFKSYDSRSGLPADTVLGILEEDDGHLWLSTQNGLSRFDPRTEAFTNYHASDGLLTDQFASPVVAAKSASGEMFFGSQKGLVAFLPGQVVERERALPVFLTDFRLFGEPVLPGSAPLEQPIWSAASLELESRSIVSFDFAALNYVDPVRTRYRYRLEGLEEKWNETNSARRSATYTTLQPGDYTFRVQARGARGDWSDSALKIRVPPPWYATWYFRTLVAALLITALWLAYRLRVRQLHRRFEIALYARLGERSRIARDLHDTLLQTYQASLLWFRTGIDALPEQPLEAKRRLELALDRAEAAIVEGRDAVQGLRASTIEVNDLAEAIAAIGAGLTKAHATADAPVVDVAVDGASRHLNPLAREEACRIAGEALRNSFHHAGARHISVTLQYGARQFRLTVADDGKGIEAATLQGQQPASHFGLPGMRERAAIIGGQLDVRSAIGRGTEVELRVPALKAYEAAARARHWWDAFQRTPSENADR
ncbi:ligand-binding sensor domain-containing protein/signal transduction histidine kinase [Hydrogenophaga palleronii]|uniref:Ligand-binding sensor domain-containing protein/signal transduction histidine kinase n=1 Tax=Hydrogenophaga palleronii TaxID=65655 RepID=A0ABU1WRN4_9BURK|nr:two-component regulator propeller domain-containing protein [Hydrogenophaga palleronii]MDR7151719.1 ligand-binding sensor domain-containing protein/signal transduction histidine kinase [Hydrogenophaga palleronii]